ncbi:hypothetical protein V8C86DRAFT_2909383 [Haematococcus lacustris]
MTLGWVRSGAGLWQLCGCSLAWLLCAAVAMAGDTMSMPMALAILASAAADSNKLLRATLMAARRAFAKLVGGSTANSSGTLTTLDHTSEPTTTVASNNSSTSSGCSCSRSARKSLLIFTLPGRCLNLAAAARAAGLPV